MSDEDRDAFLQKIMDIHNELDRIAVKPAPYWCIDCGAKFIAYPPQIEGFGKVQCPDCILKWYKEQYEQETE